MAESKYTDQELRVGRDSILSMVNLLNHIVEDLRTRVVTAATGTVVNDDDNYTGRTEGNVELNGNFVIDGNIGVIGSITTANTNTLIPVNGIRLGSGNSLPTAEMGGLFLLLEDGSNNNKGLYHCTSTTDGWIRI